MRRTLSKKLRIVPTLLFMMLLLLSVSNASAHTTTSSDQATSTTTDTKTGDMATTSTKPVAKNEDLTGLINFDEKPGNFIDLTLTFKDEDNELIQLKDLITRPTILSIIYYRCPNICALVTTNLASTLKNTDFKPGEEPNIITLSVNSNENHVDAKKMKMIAMATIDKKYSPERWHFLTGNEDNIKKLTDSVGLQYRANGDDFEHPLGLVVLSPKGKIVRYILGTEILPADITMSLMEAETGTIKPTLARALRICFTYDPKSHKYVFNILQVSATVTLTIIGVFMIYLVFFGKKRTQKEEKNV